MIHTAPTFTGKTYDWVRRAVATNWQTIHAAISPADFAALKADMAGANTFVDGQMKLVGINNIMVLTTSVSESEKVPEGQIKFFKRRQDAIAFIKEVQP